jgi:hypothetical protein
MVMVLWGVSLYERIENRAGFFLKEERDLTFNRKEIKIKKENENRKTILERIEKIRDEVNMLDRAAYQKSAGCYIREGETLICDVCGSTISSGNVAYLLLGDGTSICGIFCDECENGRSE